MCVGCSSKKFLQPGQRVLSNVKVTSSNSRFKVGAYKKYVRQHPNTRWFNVFKAPLGLYCLSKADSVKGNKGLSKFFKKIGEPPVVYDSEGTLYGMRNIEQALYSDGYLHAQVDTLVQTSKHKVKVTYCITPRDRYYIDTLRYDFDDDTIYSIYKGDSANSLLRRGMPLNLNVLSEERSRMVKMLRQKGYYFVNNDFITYDIDTLRGITATNVTLRMHRPEMADSSRSYTRQRFRQVYITQFRTIGEDSVAASNSALTNYRGIMFDTRQLKVNKRVLLSHTAINKGAVYDETDVQNTYNNLNSLPVVKFTNMQVVPVTDTDSLLDCNISLRYNKTNSIGLEVEGTNTSGDLGAAVALSYNNRNAFKGSEMLTFKLRGAYEAISGLEGYNNQNYFELSAEGSLRFPTLLLPFLSIEKKKEMKALSQVSLMYNTQDRPEFHRRVLTAAWTYTWNRTNTPRWVHNFDLLSVNYVYMPWISDTFKKDYLDGEDARYSVLRSSYENLFIVKTAYSLTYNSQRNNANGGNYSQSLTQGVQVKAGVELAGNVLYGISNMLHRGKGDNGCYNLFGISYSQYAKFDFDFVRSLLLNDRNAVAIHFGFGLGIPYGNSTILPYEKRYFAGGANSVRGWNVRGLGPGGYKGKDGKVDFVTQTGNLKLDFNVEWRTFLFWKLHGALFVDAGNIWNTRHYAGIDNAVFKFGSFYKQIAVSYGLGIRFDFNYFILRFDGGMKAIDPSVSKGRLHYPITKPNFGRDFTLHFAVGLPF